MTTILSLARSLVASPVTPRNRYSVSGVATAPPVVGYDQCDTAIPPCEMLGEPPIVKLFIAKLQGVTVQSVLAYPSTVMLHRCGVSGSSRAVTIAPLA